MKNSVQRVMEHYGQNSVQRALGVTPIPREIETKPGFRLSRGKFVIYILVSVAFLFGLDAVIGGTTAGSNAVAVFAVLFFLTTVVLCYFRLHDINTTGAWLLLFILAGATGLLLTIFLCFKRGTKGPNKYGEDPLGIKAVSRPISSVA